MVFNAGMNQIESDAELIKSLGGPTKVAQALSSDPPVSVQRVQNWLTRGIPSHIKVKYPQMFMPELAQVPVNSQKFATENVAQG